MKATDKMVATAHEYLSGWSCPVEEVREALEAALADVPEASRAEAHHDVRIPLTSPSDLQLGVQAILADAERLSATAQKLNPRNQAAAAEADRLERESARYVGAALWLSQAAADAAGSGAMSAELEYHRRREEMLDALLGRWRTMAEHAAHDHEGEEYQIGVAAGIRYCRDGLLDALERDVITGESAK